MSYWAGKRVLVTGGGGFLGSHVVSLLRGKACDRIVVLHSNDCDLTKEAEVRQLFENDRFEVVFHLAGFVGGIGANRTYPVDFYFNNIMMNTLTIDYACKAGVDKVIAAGAGCGYPEQGPLPLAEDRFWDGFPQADSAPYSLAKRMLHVQSIAYWNQYRFPIVTTIPGNIYGPRDNFDLENAHVVPALVRKFVEAVDDGTSEIEIWGGGSPTRDFVYAEDVAEGMIKAAEIRDQPGLVNLASGRETNVREVVETLREITGFCGELVWNRDRPEGQSRRVFDVSRAKEWLGWEAKTSLREGLLATVQWYRKYRLTARNLEPLGQNRVFVS